MPKVLRLNLRLFKFLINLIIIFIISSNILQANKTVIWVDSYPNYLIMNELVGTKAIVKFYQDTNKINSKIEANLNNELENDNPVAVICFSEKNEKWLEFVDNKLKIKIEDYIDKKELNLIKEKGSNSDSLSKDSNQKSVFVSLAKINIPKDDPNYWADPILVKKVTSKLVDTLAKLDVANANSYKINMDIFHSRLDLLDRQVRKIFVPINFKKILTFDSPLLYFFKRYKVPMLNNLQSNKIGQMSVDELTKQIEEVKSKEIKAIVWNRQFSNQKNVSFFADKCGIIPDEISMPNSREKVQYSSLILFIAKKVAAL